MWLNYVAFWINWIPTILLNASVSWKKKRKYYFKNLQTIKTEKDLEQREPSYTTGNNVNSPWRTAWRFLKKLKIELPYNLAIPCLGIYPRKNIIQKYTCTPIFIATLFTKARTWKQPKFPLTDEWTYTLPVFYY